MTNFFGFRVIKGELTEPMDGIDFITKTRSDEETQKFWQYQMKNYRFRSSWKMYLSIVLFLLRMICLFVWVCTFLGALLMPLERPDFDLVQSFHNASLLWWGAVCCFVVWLVLMIYDRVCIEHIVDTTKPEIIDQKNPLAKDGMEILGIPEMAERIDVLSEHYTMKEGKPKHKDSNYGMTPYTNFDMFVYVQNGNLCLADAKHVWEIPLSSLRSMTLEKWIYGYPDWNKSEPMNSDKYRPYRIIRESGVYYSRCYRIEISDIRGEFYLLIPVYDGEAFTRVTHLRPEEKL